MRTIFWITAMLLVAAGVAMCAANMSTNKHEVMQRRYYDDAALWNGSAEIPQLVEYDRSYEKPKDQEFAKLLEDALTYVQEKENLIRYMVNSGMVQTNTCKGQLVGRFDFLEENITYSFSLSAGPRKIGQFDKKYYTAGRHKGRNRTQDKTKKLGFVFDVDTDSVRSFYSNMPQNELLVISFSFYPSNKLERCGLRIKDKWLSARWNTNGKLIDE